MLPFLKRLLDLVLPQKERLVRLDSYKPHHLAPSPQAIQADGCEIITLMSYRTPAVDDCIRALKYDRASSAAPLLANVLAEYLHEEVRTFRAFSQRPIMLVPVPLHASRMRERGFNQMESVLRALPKEFTDGTRSSLVTNALVRTRETAQQTRLSRAERIENMRDAFALSDVARLRHAHVFLLDDVVTTGATLTEAARPLIAAGIAVEMIALARA